MFRGSGTWLPVGIIIRKRKDKKSEIAYLKPTSVFCFHQCFETGSFYIELCVPSLETCRHYSTGWIRASSLHEYIAKSIITPSEIWAKSWAAFKGDVCTWACAVVWSPERASSTCSESGRPQPDPSLVLRIECRAYLRAPACCRGEAPSRANWCRCQGVAVSLGEFSCWVGNDHFACYLFVSSSTEILGIILFLFLTFITRLPSGIIYGGCFPFVYTTVWYFISSRRRSLCRRTLQDLIVRSSVTLRRSSLGLS